ncbi:MAG: diphosphomevalonate decarboxylase [Bdellovibrionales bacterium]|nr:diphosphomevalonate decarboxylase [Bdellovibrionales bacterium]
MSEWRASAPANIALIKYMGKTNSDINLPTNGSLSLTLEKLRTYVVIQVLTDKTEDQWQCLDEMGLEKITLSEKGRLRFLKAWLFLKKFFAIEGSFVIRSANNFPADCGIASSASSFAALTLASYEVAKDLGKKSLDVNLQKLAELSRGFSGSSCRSFIGPLCEWSDAVQSVESTYENLFHYVVIVDAAKKQVSSSEAHLRVQTSQLFNGRAERAQWRLQAVKECLVDTSITSWKKLFQLCWEEFWDMHALFETSDPNFGYMRPESLFVQEQVRKLWSAFQDGPLLTMDAGANIHFVWRKDQKTMAHAFKAELENKKFKVIIGND